MQPHQRCFGKERHYSAGEERQQRQPRCSEALLCCQRLVGQNRERGRGQSHFSKLVARFLSVTLYAKVNAPRMHARTEK